MDIMNVIGLLVVIMFGSIRATHKTTVYQNFRNNDIPSPSLVIPCARTMAKSAKLVAFRFNPSTDRCRELVKSWLANKQTVPTDDYMTVVGSDEVFDPPMHLYWNTIDDRLQYARTVPMELRDGSLFEIYISGTVPAARIFAVFRYFQDYVLRVDVQYSVPAILLQYRFNGTFSTPDIVNVGLTLGKIEKFSFKILGNDIQIYHDDQWLVTYNEVTNPNSPADIEHLIILVDKGDIVGGRLHQVVHRH